MYSTNIPTGESSMLIHWLWNDSNQNGTLRTSQICCRVVHVFIFCQFRTCVFVFCQTLSLCGTDEIIIASVDFFCILCFFSLKACLFDLSLITFKHHKAFECFLPLFPYLFLFLKHLASKAAVSVFLPVSHSLTFCMYFSLVFSFHLYFILVKEIKTLHFCLFICVCLSHTAENRETEQNERVCWS